jgi:hypothetical protein
MLRRENISIVADHEISRSQIYYGAGVRTVERLHGRKNGKGD